MTNRKWERLTSDQKQKAVDDLILFFENERDEKIGMIAAEQILNFILQTTGKVIYNKGIEDAKMLMDQRFQELNFDLDDLVNI